MPRLTIPILLALVLLAPTLPAGPVLDSMDELRFRAPKEKGKAELVEGKVGKAVRFHFAKDAGSAFFTSNLRGRPEWDRAAGLSFWVKGDGSDSFAGLELIFDDDYAVRYDYCFSIKSKDWRKVTVAWSDLLPVLPGPKSKPLGAKGGNLPSKVSAVWFGKWWYWRDYPAHSFVIDEIRLEEKIDRDARDYRPAGKPLARVLAKLQAGKPVTIVTVGDSLTDLRHWANRKVSWPAMLKKQLEEKYRSKIAIVNPAIGGTQLRQGVVLMPRWLDSHPEPDLVTFCYGGNDWDAGMRGEQFRESCADAIDRVRRATRGTADVLLFTTVPSLKRWTTQAELAEACRVAATSRKAGLADAEKAFLAAGKEKKDLFVWDQTHLGAVGHELMARVVREAIERAGEPSASAKPASVAGPGTIPITAPKPHQVVQRVGYDPVVAAKQQPGGAAFGFADIPVRADFGKGMGGETWEYRVVLLANAAGRAIGWTKLDVRAKNVTARVPAGGWYRLELRGRVNENVTLRGSVEPIGVGEVFLVAGQSYATNCNDERLKVADPHGRVTALNTATDTWAVAHDPQPTPDGSNGGSIWPPLGDALCKEFRVPIGFANVAVGATSSEQWMPEGKLHPRLVKAGKTLGRFRAILWQQGESDVIARTTTPRYVANLKTIRASAVKAWGTQPPWLLAKSTHHPTVYNNPEGEGRIRKAIDELAKLPGFEAGPDTDTLKGENRGGVKSRRHFSGIGQRRAAAMWFAVLKQHLKSPRPLRETVSELKLLEPVWLSPVVHRESSVLFQMRADGPITARLAFPAAEILDISTADRQHRFDLSRDVKLSDDGLVLTITKPGRVEPIKASDFFPPKDTPNSYRHRTGHPDQNLLYRPGHWFHDRNIEITYRRRKAPASAAKHAGTLPKTLARINAGKPITLGISGDSISTGLDASAMSKAKPNQPGYPDLVSAQLQATFGCDVVLKNRAVSGWSIANGLKDIDKLLAEKPHLIVVAYGMNDVGRRDPKWFGKQVRSILDRVHAAAPETEVILVSPMLGHAEWIHTPREMFARYRDELKALTGPGVALADVSAVWELLLRNKHDLDLTGNGLNHPNDFGHRLYAQAILSLLVNAAKTPASK